MWANMALAYERLRIRLKPDRQSAQLRHSIEASDVRCACDREAPRPLKLSHRRGASGGGALTREPARKFYRERCTTHFTNSTRRQRPCGQEEAPGTRNCANISSAQAPNQSIGSLPVEAEQCGVLENRATQHYASCFDYPRAIAKGTRRHKGDDATF